MAERDFIGRGWSYPFKFDESTGGVSKDRGTGDAQKKERINDSLQQIFGVKKGEMFMRRRFGSNLKALIFQLSTMKLAQRLQFSATKAVEDRQFGEKRIFLERAVAIVPDRSPRVTLSVAYTIRKTNIEGNLVYPLYLEEGEREAAERGVQEG